jgi:hypothetical protein
MFLAITIYYLIVIFNPMANLDFECFRRYYSGSAGKIGQVSLQEQGTHIWEAIQKRSTALTGE